MYCQSFSIYSVKSFGVIIFQMKLFYFIYNIFPLTFLAKKKRIHLQSMHFYYSSIAVYIVQDKCAIITWSDRLLYFNDWDCCFKWGFMKWLCFSSFFFLFAIRSYFFFVALLKNLIVLYIMDCFFFFFLWICF